MSFYKDTAQFVAAAAVLAIVLWVFRGLYRITIHPLAKFPGPKFAAFTRIPSIRASITGQTHTYAHALHEVYGPVVRTSPDEISFIQPEAWKHIFGTGAKGEPGVAPPKDFNRQARSINGHDSLVSYHDDREHREKRRIFSPAFSDRALKKQENMFQRYANQLMDILSSKINEKEDVFDLVSMYNFTTFDVMADLVFGESLGMLEKNEYDPWVTTVFESFKAGALLGELRSSYPLAYRVLMLLAGAKVEAQQWDHFNKTIARVDKRMSQGIHSTGQNIFDLVLGTASDEGANATTLLPRGEIDSNATVFMVAGTETTATLLSGLTYLLLKNPEPYKKLVDEVRSSFGSAEDLTMESLARLPYLNACVKEGLRMYPPVPVALTHKTPAPGSTICGHYVPPNTVVGIHQYAVNFSESNFKSAKSFIPERWLQVSEFENDHREAFQPFSYGNRDCIGKNMAQHESRLLLAKMVYHFDFELQPESEGWIDQQTFILWQKGPLMVKLSHAVR